MQYGAAFGRWHTVRLSPASRPPCTHLRDDLGMLPRGMELAVYLLAEDERVIAPAQTLL
jgi:hypothetical protein